MKSCFATASIFSVLRDDEVDGKRGTDVPTAAGGSERALAIRYPRTVERRGTECDRALRSATRGSALEEEEEGEQEEGRETEVDGEENKRKRKGARCAGTHARTHAKRHVFISLMSILLKKYNMELATGYGVP